MSENRISVKSKPNIKTDKKSNKGKKHEKGQYFTTNTFLKESVYKLIKNNPNVILEPSVGQGDLIDFVKKKIIK